MEMDMEDPSSLPGAAPAEEDLLLNLPYEERVENKVC